MWWNSKALKTLKKYIWKNSTGRSPSRNQDVLTPDNPQTSLWAVSWRNYFPSVSLHRRMPASVTKLANSAAQPRRTHQTSQKQAWSNLFLTHLLLFFCNLVLLYCRGGQTSHTELTPEQARSIKSTTGKRTNMYFWILWRTLPLIGWAVSPDWSLEHRARRGASTTSLVFGESLVNQLFRALLSTQLDKLFYFWKPHSSFLGEIYFLHSLPPAGTDFEA